MIQTFKQIFFGMRVFFRHLTIKNYKKIIIFMWRRLCLRKPIPFSVVFALTYKCQCNCVHCSVADYENKNNELTTDEAKSVLDFIAAWGPLKITFFGGEPLLRNDLVDLVSYASQKGMRTSIDTNGILLDRQMVVDLKKAGIGNINVSIDSSAAFVHDALRQSDGCFLSAIEGLKLCTQHAIPCLISTYASKRALREGDLERIVALARKMRLNGVKILFPILSGKWRENESERLGPEEEKHLESLLDPSFVYIEDALEMVKKRQKGCSAMERNLVYISPYGDIQPCPAIPISFGNVRDEDPKDIIKRMSDHTFYKKYSSCDKCLMNEQRFRESYFSVKNNRRLPLDVGELKI